MSTSPALRTLPDYWDRNRREPFTPTVLPSLDATVTRRLSLVERATVRVTALTPDAVPAGRSILLESSFRLALLRLRGELPYMSGTRLAEMLELVFFGSHKSPYASRGWEILGALDAGALAEVWISAEPVPTDPNRFRRIRLAERLEELTAA